MAAGDVVNGITSGSNIFFQPAAGVEIMITSLGDIDDASCSGGLWNGAAGSDVISRGAGYMFQPKIFINNTNYLFVWGSGTNNRGYSGIQIK